MLLLGIIFKNDFRLDAASFSGRNLGEKGFISGFSLNKANNTIRCWCKLETAAYVVFFAFGTASLSE